VAKGKKYGGRRKGTPNRVTADVRAAIAQIAQRNVEKFEGWLERTAKKNPAKAADLFLAAIEYHIPKLSRAELTGEGGKPIEVKLVRYSNTEPVGPKTVPARPVESP
jgi:hypothetical protein